MAMESTLPGPMKRAVRASSADGTNRLADKAARRR